MTKREKTRLAVYTLGFFRPNLKTRLAALGIRLIPFRAKGADAVGVWGRKPVSKRGFHAAKTHNLPVTSFEDAFLRSVKPGAKAPPFGIIEDSEGIYFDTSSPSEFANALLSASSDTRARAFIDYQKARGISKYNLVPRGNWTESGYVLVIDQVRDDASVIYGSRGAEDFEAMLEAAKAEYPDDKIYIKGHPARAGYLDEVAQDARVKYIKNAINPWDLLEGAKAVYVVSSQMGFEAILAGHRPVVFGAPFYAGVGLSDDRAMNLRKPLSTETLYSHAMMNFPHWFDEAGRESDFESALFGLDAQAHWFWRANFTPEFHNMRAWKRPYIRRFFPKSALARKSISWGEVREDCQYTMEDGFIRSRGLGANLVPPLSLVIDRQGIYFDPKRPSDLEDYISNSLQLPEVALNRAAQLRAKIVENNLSKYNLSGDAPTLQLPSDKEVILVVGQVEDDRSIIEGAIGEIKTNAALLAAARRDYPDSYILYKPHPDVEAGLRKGKINANAADKIVTNVDIAALWAHIDRLATITSLSGFEALLRGKRVTCYGAPFYAGWGFTEDRFPPISRRNARPSLDGFVHAVLIDYPVYRDPLSGQICRPELVLERIAKNETSQPRYLALLTNLQVAFYRGLDRFRGA